MDLLNPDLALTPLPGASIVPLAEALKFLIISFSTYTLAWVSLI